MRLLYNIAISIYGWLLVLAKPFNAKAAALVDGRKNQDIPGKELGRKRLWLHTSSVGEFEQGLPFLKEFQKDFPSWEIIISFYSPSGYKMAEEASIKNSYVYLPLDSSKKAIAFVERMDPDLCVFVKYDVWPNLYNAIGSKRIPLVMLATTAGTLKKYFHFPMNLMFSTAMKAVSLYLTQSEYDKKALEKHTTSPVVRGGNTRVDRVLEIARMEFSSSIRLGIPEDALLIIAGSAWPEDISMFERSGILEKENVYCLIVPHEIDKWPYSNISANYSLAIDHDAVKFSPDRRIWTLLQTGVLSKLYRFADVAYVGGGFKTGLHNTLEAAVYGIPVLFGPKHEKFPEASDLIRIGGAASFETAREFNSLIREMSKISVRSNMGQKAATYLMKEEGSARANLRIISKVIFNQPAKPEGS